MSIPESTVDLAFEEFMKYKIICKNAPPKIISSHCALCGASAFEPAKNRGQNFGSTFLNIFYKHAMYFQWPEGFLVILNPN